MVMSAWIVACIRWMWCGRGGGEASVEGGVGDVGTEWNVGLWMGVIRQQRYR